MRITFAPPAQRGFSQCVTHLAAGAVSDIAYRVDWLARGAGRDQDGLPGQILFSLQRFQHGKNNRFIRRQPARTNHAACQVTAVRLHDRNATIFQRLNMAWVAAFSHMFTFIAGATTTARSWPGTMS